MNGFIPGFICHSPAAIPSNIKLKTMEERSYIKIGIAGPVGSGKTALIERLTRRLLPDYELGVITNDIYTKEDAEFLTRNSLLPAGRGYRNQHGARHPRPARQKTHP